MQPPPDAPATAAAAAVDFNRRRLPPPPSVALVVTPSRFDIGQCPPLSDAPAAATVVRARRRRPLPSKPGKAFSSNRFRCCPHSLLLSPTLAAPFAAYHGRPRPPAVTTVGGGGAWDRAHPGRAGHDLAAHSWTVRKDGTARTPEERTGQGLHFFLSHLALGEVPVPGLERVTLVGVDEDRRMHLMHSLFSVRVDIYSTEFRLFACLRKLPVKGLPPVMEILPDFFVARRSVRAVPHIDHIAHLGGISPRDW